MYNGSLERNVFYADNLRLPLVVHVKAHLNDLSWVDALSFSDANVPVLLYIYRDYYQGGEVMMLRFPDGWVDKGKVQYPLWHFLAIPKPFALKRLVICWNYFVEIIVRKKVRAHDPSGLREKLMAQTLWEK